MAVDDAALIADANAAAAAGARHSSHPAVCEGRGFLRRALVWGAGYTNHCQEMAAACIKPEDTASAQRRLGETCRLRVAAAADVPTLMALIRELAVFEREPDGVKTTEASMLRDGFGDEPLFHSLIAEAPTSDGGWTPVATAICHSIYSTWEGRSLYLEDLYVVPSSRRQGVSGILFAALARAAAVSGCARLQWSVLKWNSPAVLAYEAMGATLLEEWRLYRLSREGGGVGRVAWGETPGRVVGPLALPPAVALLSNGEAAEPAAALASV